MYASVTGLNKQRKIMKDMSDPKRHDKALEELVNKTAELMGFWCPHFTGFMEETITVLKNGVLDYTIWIPARYAHFTEYGTKYIEVPDDVGNPKLFKSMSGKMSYRPWARPAVWHYINKYPEIMKGIVVSGL